MLTKNLNIRSDICDITTSLYYNTGAHTLRMDFSTFEINNICLFIDLGIFSEVEGVKTLKNYRDS